MSSRIQPTRLIDELHLSGQAQVTGTISLVTDVPRIESVIARGHSAAGNPIQYKVEWAGGVTTTEIMGDGTGESDRFQPYDPDDGPDTADANADLINTAADGTHILATQEWILAPFPAVLWPYIRFRLTPILSAVDANFSLYVILRKRFDNP